MKVLIETKELSDAIIEIIQSANKNLWLISPYLQFSSNSGEEWPELTDALKGAQSRGIEIQCIFRKNQNKNPVTELRTVLSEDRVSAFLINDLHAKIYCNETQILISSMNLFAHSFVANYEIGILISKDDSTNFGRVFTYIEKLKRKGLLPPKDDIKDSSTNIPSAKDPKREVIFTWITSNIPAKKKRISVLELVEQYPEISKLELTKILLKFAESHEHYFYIQDDECLEYIEKPGFCIVCARKIEFDTDLHIVRCLNCYNSDIKRGKVCHKCGTEGLTYPNKPLCSICYSSQLEIEKRTSNSTTKLSLSTGYCIKCGNNIPIDMTLEKVRCIDCWKYNRNGAVVGNKCHICGKNFHASLEEPLCSECTKKYTTNK